MEHESVSLYLHPETLGSTLKSYKELKTSVSLVISFRGESMKEKILVIPKEEVIKHFEQNSRQDIKVIVPEILTDGLYKILRDKGKELKKEQFLKGIYWEHSKADDPNNVLEARSFNIDSLLKQNMDPFNISFANERAQQDSHYHRQHLELYYSEHALCAEYRALKDTKVNTIKLKNGGLIIFGTDVVHKMKLSGLTIVIEIPSLKNDKEDVVL